MISLNQILLFPTLPFLLNRAILQKVFVFANVFLPPAGTTKIPPPLAPDPDKSNTNDTFL